MAYSHCCDRRGRGLTWPLASQGKSAAMKRAIEGSETLQTFPASGLRGVATWIIDEAAASELSEEYRV